MEAPNECWEDLAALSLKDPQPEGSPGEEGPPTDRESPATNSSEQPAPPAPPAAEKPLGTPDEDVDIALKQALGGEMRTWVLQLEEMVANFVGEDAEQLEFPPNCSNFQRMLMHKVAQHYKLQTFTAGAAAVGQGRVVAKRTKYTRAPQVKLAALPFKPRSPGPDGAAAGGPKSLIKRPGSNGSLSRGAGSGSEGAGPGQMSKSHRERVEDYNAARERLLGRGDGEGDGGEQGEGQASPHANGGALHYSGEYPEGPGQQHGGQQQQQPRANGGPHYHARGGRGGGRGGGANGYGGGGGGAKAVYRDRERELQDPDYRRGVQRFQPRFDPSGYGGPQQQHGMYNMPTYGSEFPSLPGAAGPSGGPQSGASWGGRPYPQPPPPPPGGRKGGNAGSSGSANGGAAAGVPVHYQQLGPVRPPHGMAVAYPPAAFYPQGMVAQPAFAPIAGYMAPPMAGAYPMAYSPYPGGPPMQYAAAPMAYGHMQHMAAAAAAHMQQGGWGAMAPPPRPPPPPPPPPPASASDERGSS